MLISDGHVCKSEFDILKQLGAERKLGLEPLLLPHIVHTLCEELLLGGFASGSPLEGVDDSALAALMTEVSDPVLQKDSAPPARAAWLWVRERHRSEAGAASVRAPESAA